jgi:hypothetical protein
MYTLLSINTKQNDYKRIIENSSLKPIKLIEEVRLTKKDNYISLLPKNLEEVFTVKDVCELTKCDNKYVSKMINVLKYLEIIEMIGKEGKKYLYKVKKG